MPATVVLLGNFADERPALDATVSKFGWSVKRASSLNGLHDMREDNIVAVLLDANSLGLSWAEALKAVLEFAPRTRPIACHRFSETVDWPQLAAAGAFHVLPLPLAAREMLQSLGFVWSARYSPSTAVPLHRPKQKQCPTLVMRGRERAVGSAA